MNAIAHSNAPATEQLIFLGKPLDFITAVLGEPLGVYPHRGSDVLMFHQNNETITCELRDGIIKSVNTFKDRRSAPRIKPRHPKQAFLRHGDKRHNATILDLSERSVAMHLKDALLPAKGEFVTFCTGLRIMAKSKIYVHLAGHVHRVSVKDNSIVVLLHTPFETQSSRALSDYVNIHRALRQVGSAITCPTAHKDWSDDNITIIKSDICNLCTEGTCGAGNAPFKDKIIPIHRGINAD